MSDNTLREAYQLMKAGERQQAYKLVMRVIKQDKQNDKAWWMVANLVEDEAKQRKALENVLHLNPEHTGAQALLDKLNGVDAKSTQEIAVDWSKLDARQKKGFRNRQVGEDRFSILNLFALGLLVVAAGFIYTFLPEIALALNLGFTPEIETPPEMVIVQFFDDYLNGDFDAMRAATCSEMTDGVENAISLYTTALQEQDISAESYFRQTDYDVSNLESSLLKAAFNRAMVNVKGTVTLNIPEFGVTETIDVEQASPIKIADGLIFTLHAEDGAWRVCSGFA